jgi:carbon monoxide dehydrogenase subunit G
MAMTLRYEFDCTPEHLFSFLIDDKKMLKWMHGVTRIEPITDGPPAVGAKARLWIKEGRKESEYVSEVTAFEPNRQVAVVLTGGCFGEGTTITADYQLNDMGNRTSLVYTCEMKSVRLIVRIMERLFRPFNRRIVKKMMRSLKELAERKD